MSHPDYIIDKPVKTKRQKRYRRVSYVFALVLLIFIIIVGVIIYDILHLKGSSSKKSVGAEIHQTIAGPQTFKSAYFQFSDNAKWVFAPNDSKPNKFVYLSYVGGVPVHSLSVYINTTPIQSDLATTNVLPVQIKNDNSFVESSLSANCNTVYVPSDLKHIKTKSISGTSMLCVPDSPQLSVMVGQIGGDYNLILKRENGQTARYIIVYHNLSIDPDPATFIRIMSTFQSL
ncbi:MAG: hypothetical protein ACHQT9_04225 [Candidatus Saccharimonadales bacterium]